MVAQASARKKEDKRAPADSASLKEGFSLSWPLVATEDLAWGTWSSETFLERPAGNEETRYGLLEMICHLCF